jgi:hypothetical protein
MLNWSTLLLANILADLPVIHSNTRNQNDRPIDRNCADGSATGGDTNKSNVTVSLTAPGGTVAL